MILDKSKKTALLQMAKEAIIAAAEVILDIYLQDDFAVEVKKDNSPVTRADKESSAIIEKILVEKSHLPVVSEENIEKYQQSTLHNKNFWLIDPVDGTKHFIKKDGQFTINLALICNGEVVAGYVYVPVSKEFYYAAKGFGAYKITDLNLASEQENKIETNGFAFKKSRKLKLLTGKTSANNKLIKGLVSNLEADYQIEKASLGSSLKMCRLAEGQIDLYPRMGPTCEWDTAAAHIILKEAGGNIITLPDLKELTVLQGNKNWENPHFIACGTPDIQWLVDAEYLPDIECRLG